MIRPNDSEIRSRTSDFFRKDFNKILELSTKANFAMRAAMTPREAAELPRCGVPKNITP